MIRSYHACAFFTLLLFLSAFPNAFSFENEEERHTAIERISVEDARARVQAGEAFLVCAYDDKRCKGLMLEGALTRREFEQKLPMLPKGQEIILYCS
ncbi:MAG: hypothetical protein P8Y80_09265 [Acidobacteriota bacterium]|jgi:hypothetical protein